MGKPIVTTAALIYPHQLYAQNPVIREDRLHVLIEEPLLFGDARYPARFHKCKLMLHRASLKRYADEVLAGHQVRYLDYAAMRQRTATVLDLLKDEGVREIHVIDPTDDLLEKRLKRAADRHNIQLHWHASPNFLTSRDQIDAFWRGRAEDDYHQTDFYIHQRQRLGLLLADDGGPVGGRWTYDTENRKKLPKDVQLPPEPEHYANAYLDEARRYVEQHFGSNPGATDAFIYPTNHAEADALLDRFLEQRLPQFGPYQDAISQRGDTLFHSLLSSSLNSGLLSPQQIVDRLMNYADAHPKTSLASVEGFLRQVIGWREFIRAVYLREGVRQRNSNFFGHQRTLEEVWYSGETGIPPIDDAIHKALRLAYNHHIERLMLVGNFMLLCEIHPDEVYRWFMEMFIDAYDWVMVPNVYGMSQYADGGLMTTKPYISSSNYVRKMSDYGKGDWSPVWDGLYWRFIDKHRDFFTGNPRLAVMTSHLKRMDDDTLAAHYEQAESFLKRIS